MSDQQRDDPWALVQPYVPEGNTIRLHYSVAGVDKARAEVERRHAEALKVKDTEHQRHFEIMQQTQNLASSIMDEQRTQIANITSERNAANARLAEVESERDKAEAERDTLRAERDEARSQASTLSTAKEEIIVDLRAQLAAVQEKAEQCVWRRDMSGAWTNPCAGASTPLAFHQRVSNMWTHCPYCGKPLTLKEPKA